ncbi:MAG: O-antigen ligase family protein [Dehalococcoidia bacterium]
MIDVRRLPQGVGPVSEWWPRALAGLAVVVAVVAFYDRPLILSAFAAGIGVLVAMTVDRRLVIPIIVLLLPLEIGGRFVPILQTEGSAKVDASALSLARMGLVVGAGLWALRAPSDWWRGFLPRSALYLPIALFLGLYAVSLLNTSDFSGAAQELGRLISHLVLLALVVIYVRDRQTLRWTLLALVASGLLLALVGLFQQATDTYLWNEALGTRGIRRNATFVDPNIYARFLVVTMVVAGALFFGERSRFRYLYAATFACAGLALPFTSSRSNWVAAAVVLPLLVFALPITSRRKLHLFVFGGLVAAAFGLGVTAFEPQLADRFNTLLSGEEAIGVRSGLLRAGWAMFLDHPIFGVGVEGFKEGVQGAYNDYLPLGSTVYHSHTAVVTVLAELGIVGLLALAFLMHRLGRLLWQLYAGARAIDQAIVAGIGGALAAIFISGQTEGRMIEEPYLWLFMGLVIALGAIRDGEAEQGVAVPGREHDTRVA